ncbi:tail assembly chaperone [Bacillus sp. 179-C3.3 HS]|uniref:tail assembly chaperone n=1 Tax=Bacillus sp. 179-C3.3 HS TaxID=3232162 RepID=UPI0039A35446
MATLTIENKEYTARCDFAFDRTANEKYTTKEEEKAGGTMNIYMGLLNEDALMLSAFWDCALSHLKSGKPTAEQIEEAIMKIVDEDTKGDAVDHLIKEAFQTLENAGFFKGKIRQQWTMMEKMAKPKKAAPNETPEMAAKRIEDEENGKEYMEMLKQARKERTGSTISKS